jgi:hypothetical protein
LVSFEALPGQIFLVSVVSRLVGLYSRVSPPPADDTNGTTGEPATS